MVLTDASGKEVARVNTGQDGAYSFEVEPNQKFTLAGSKPNYSKDKKDADTGTDQDELIIDLTLEKNPQMYLYVLVKDKTTDSPLANVSIRLVNKRTGLKEDLVTAESGDCMRALAEYKMRDTVNFFLTVEKEGYLATTVSFKTVLDHDDKYEQICYLDKIDIGADLSKLININPIYFDLNKYNIRKDAAVELDKIVKVMNENPSMVIELGSHTDCRGSIASNEKLSDNRAKASAAYIKEKISNPDRIYGKGYGESKLKNGCACEGAVKSTCTEEEHQQNRRTEFIIKKM